MAEQQMENLIDLGKYPRNDVELISREFIRIVYLETLDAYVQEQQKETPDKTVTSNMEDAMKGLETTIIILDGGPEFLEYVHKDADTSADNDDEFERF
jgi:hypothetical protein